MIGFGFSDGMDRVCSLCGVFVAGQTGFKCGKCECVIYCGMRCQRWHWDETHKFTCLYHGVNRLQCVKTYVAGQLDREMK